MKVSMRTHIERIVFPQPQLITNSNLTCSAVLVPFVENQNGLSILLTKRTAHLHHHAGQICFPGGRCDAQDIDFKMTALRETKEEIGISQEFIEVAGFLENYATITGFMITPVVGFLKEGFEIQKDQFEVAEIFELPLTFILDSANYYQESYEYQGVTRDYYVIPFQNHKIWGATAGILIKFAQRLLSTV